jgi:hypothetical protein
MYGLKILCGAIDFQKKCNSYHKCLWNWKRGGHTEMLLIFVLIVMLMNYWI